MQLATLIRCSMTREIGPAAKAVLGKTSAIFAILGIRGAAKGAQLGIKPIDRRRFPQITDRTKFGDCEKGNHFGACAIAHLPVQTLRLYAVNKNTMRVAEGNKPSCSRASPHCRSPPSRSLELPDVLSSSDKVGVTNCVSGSVQLFAVRGRCAETFPHNHTWYRERRRIRRSTT